MARLKFFLQNSSKISGQIFYQSTKRGLKAFRNKFLTFPVNYIVSILHRCGPHPKSGKVTIWHTDGYKNGAYALAIT